MPRRQNGALVVETAHQHRDAVVRELAHQAVDFRLGADIDAACGLLHKQDVDRLQLGGVQRARRDVDRLLAVAREEDLPQPGAFTVWRQLGKQVLLVLPQPVEKVERVTVEATQPGCVAEVTVH